MIKLGIPYVAASILNSLTALAVPAVILYLGCMDDVGLYKVGYSLMVVYAGIVFVAVESDYFPRLSAVNGKPSLMNRIINQQVDICVLLITPLLLFMLSAMPVIIRVLYTGEFLSVVNMAIFSVFYMFFKAVVLPVAYTALAKGDSVTYLCMETAYDIFSFALIAAGYYYGGITGTGIALSLSSLLDVLMIYICYSRKYGFSLSVSTMRLVLLQGTLLFAGVAVTIFCTGWPKWCLCILLLFASIAYSLQLLQSNSTMLAAVKRRFLRSRAEK